RALQDLEIEAAYRDDPARLAAYNLEDARLVLEILERTRLVELAVERSLSTGMQLDRVGAAIASVDSLYLRALRARGRVAPSVRAAESAGAGIVGGLVLDSRPGLYRNILVFAGLGSPASRLFSPAVANAITTAGQHVIRLAAAAVADLGHRVIYGDTDSLFVDLGEADPARAAARGEELRAAIGGAVGDAD